MARTIRMSARKLLLGGLFGAVLGLGGVGAWALGQAPRPAAADWVPQPAEQVVEEPVRPPSGAQVPVCLVHSRRIRLNYEIREVGPSGVSRVELWATRDGRTWQRYFDERPSPGPLLVHVAEEGRYGFTILVKNGVGGSAKAPVAGDAPQMWVEVDETKPTVQLHDVKVGHDADAGKVTISWSACDANLHDRPYVLSYSATPEGPWLPIVGELEKGTNHYTWTMPKDVPYRFHVRVEASDKAGNVGAATTTQPVTVDHAQPRGVILGVDAEPAQPRDK